MAQTHDALNDVTTQKEVCQCWSRWRIGPRAATRAYNVTLHQVWTGGSSDRCTTSLPPPSPPSFSYSHTSPTLATFGWPPSPDGLDAEHEECVFVCV